MRVANKVTHTDKSIVTIKTLVVIWAIALSTGRMAAHTTTTLFLRVEPN